MTTKTINPEKIPASLRERQQWVLWRLASRTKGDAPTKLPFTVGGKMAKADDPSTWSTFEDVLQVYHRGPYSGIGFEFSATDPFVGIDLDGCRNPETGEVAAWAKGIVTNLDSYAEISPSETGIKIWAKGKLPFDKGRKLELPELKVCDKTPAIEVYDHGRYFATTGWKLAGVPAEPQDRQEQVISLCNQFWPADSHSASNEFYTPAAVIDRARKYLATLPPAISGSGGHNAAFRSACVLLLGFMLDRNEALSLLREWNQLCQPPWSDRELEHKVDSASKQPGDRGYLRNARPETWNSVRVPNYEAPKPKRKPKQVTLGAAVQAYIDRMKQGETGLIETGIPELDYAIGGGLEFGEMVIAAARPSHGKSAFALQCAHHWTALGLPTLIVSEEMSTLALGKRTLQFITDVPQERWERSADELERDLGEYVSGRATCIVSEPCVTPLAVVDAIERARDEHNIQAVVVDYAQLLQGKGHTRYEQVSNVSNTLREAASRLNVLLLALCQLNREVEKRTKFIPCVADIRDAGTLEQDADVILLLAWPHRVDPKQPANQFQIFVAKNRNRPINQPLVLCRFDPTRQTISESTAREMPNYRPEFADFEDPFESKLR